MSETQIVLFLLTSLLVIVTPGQDMILVMSRSLAQGSSAGMATAGGISLGLVGHTALAALGLGSILMASATLFLILKLVGAAYLVYLGVRLLRTRAAALDLSEARPSSLARLFAEGALSNLSNPKVTIFYLAFLPQFVPGDAEHPTLLISGLGMAFSLLTFLVKGLVGYFAGALSAWLRARPRALTGVYRTSGAMMVGMGVKLAFERRT
ncbi:LysE family translocator [Sorangium sp. So ce1078]|uniref:LysE family translocator n=1 Tax=Sorangium sp. So ce1078 TaxID=3133329 RepID=UPI003F6047C4